MGDFNRNFGRRRSGRGRFGRRGRGRDKPSEMHSGICDKCGKDCEVPFKPTQGKPLYCSDCFEEKSREAGSKSGFGKPSNEALDQINKKLDRILSILEAPKEHIDGKPKKEQPEPKKKPKKKKS